MFVETQLIQWRFVLTETSPGGRFWSPSRFIAFTPGALRCPFWHCNDFDLRPLPSKHSILHIDTKPYGVDNITRAIWFSPLDLHEWFKWMSIYWNRFLRDGLWVTALLFFEVVIQDNAAAPEEPATSGGMLWLLVIVNACAFVLICSICFLICDRYRRKRAKVKIVAMPDRAPSKGSKNSKREGDETTRRPKVAAEVSVKTKQKRNLINFLLRKKNMTLMSKFFWIKWMCLFDFFH